MNEQDLNAWCSLWRAPGVGVKTFYQLVAAFGSPQAFFGASNRELAANLANVSVKKCQVWQAAQGSGQQDLAWLHQGKNRAIITLDSSLYPDLLKEIADPPPILFAHGDVSLLQQPQIAIVGSRNATAPGLNNCREFAKALSAQGLGITSGMALGIDAAAHEAALTVGGKTVAVVATGLDRVYPSSNRQLAYEIADKGLIVSELPIGTGVRSGHFPRRNRLISGLSIGVLVVEASVKSGSLITARMAAEQGREVFAIPGSIHHPLAKGCHYLIKQGAKLVETAQDIIEELNVTDCSDCEKPRIDDLSQTIPASAEHNDPACRVLLDIMGYDPRHIDELVGQSELTSGEISAMLLMLELDGWVESLAGGMFQRVK
ncbi:MAG: DNA-protecting protein DprA [Cardiobacteriales bacterium]|nr:MAG: DNA-protecting protein DprA [Cardiobacteriales bacterium]